ncbi:protein-L-histidine N-pros-methyltransferase isoform X2 [Patella vulgata]|nr:protein-L-histidine N-pros-methyltransferase isoform X2 [Patella vulgata]
MGEWTGRRFRSPLARTVYYKLLDDQRHREDTHPYWYRFEVDKIPEELKDKFMPCHQDTETSLFLENCYEKSDYIFTQLYFSMARSVLSWFMSPTSINGWLDRGSMFIFSQNQIKDLLNITDDWRAENFLDLGAGDGKITQKLSHLFNQVYATEASNVMIKRLKERNFSVLDIDAWDNGNITYDLIGCLNLLDRCDKPISILHSIKKSLRKGGGRALVAVVLPFSSYVEEGSSDHQPTEKIHVEGSSFEEQATSLIKHVFEPAGFNVDKFTRVPYLCEGDMGKSFYVLDDALFVLSPKVTS